MKKILDAVFLPVEMFEYQVSFPASRIHHKKITNMKHILLLIYLIPFALKQSVSSISANTGNAPAKRTASTEAMNVNGGTITSSPAPTPAAASAHATAVEPLLTACAYLAPVIFFTSFSNSRAFQMLLRCASWL